MEDRTKTTCIATYLFPWGIIVTMHLYRHTFDSSVLGSPWSSILVSIMANLPVYIGPYMFWHPYFFPFQFMQKNHLSLSCFFIFGSLFSFMLSTKDNIIGFFIVYCKLLTLFATWFFWPGLPLYVSFSNKIEFLQKSIFRQTTVSIIHFFLDCLCWKLWTFIKKLQCLWSSRLVFVDTFLEFLFFIMYNMCFHRMVRLVGAFVRTSRLNIAYNASILM